MRIVLYLVLLAVAAQGQAAKSALDTVRNFYSWYFPGHSFEEALEARRADFDKALYAALRADLTAASKSPDEIVGLDFDPFLNTQDPCQRYEVGPAKVTGTSARVEIHGVCEGKKAAKVDVIVALRQENGRWVFTNFLYPGADDLVKVLRVLKRERK
jgi:hypothetical protein